MANVSTDLNGISDPLRLLARWVREAVDGDEPSARCMTFASADADGTPHARTVLTTAIDDHSVRFHTSWPSVKAADLAQNPRAAGVFFWPGPLRQVTLHGTAHELGADASRAAFPAQSPNLRALAWAYDELSGRSPGESVDPERVRRVFERELARDRQDAPPSWTTIALVPDRLEFWWMPPSPGIATKARFERATDGGWTQRYILP